MEEQKEKVRQAGTLDPSKEQIKRDVLQGIIDGADSYTSDMLAAAVFGLVYEAGQKTIAIKAYRGRFGTGFKESKEAIERQLDTLR